MGTLEGRQTRNGNNEEEVARLDDNLVETEGTRMSERETDEQEEQREEADGFCEVIEWNGN